MSAVGKAVGKVTGFLSGGDQKPIESQTFGSAGAGEQDRQASIEDQINRLFADPRASAEMSQTPQIQSLFADNLKSFLLKNGQNTPEDIQKASDFVDQTFTTPAQGQLNQQINDLQSQYNAKAAAMGRNPNADLATQQAFVADATKAGLGLQSERGSRIQQQVQNNNNQNLQSLNMGMQGSGFLSNLGQQAFTNRLSLLNGLSGLSAYDQMNRQQKAAGIQTSPGLFGNLTSLAKGAKNTYGAFSSFSGGGDNPSTNGLEGVTPSSFNNFGSGGGGFSLGGIGGGA